MSRSRKLFNGFSQRTGAARRTTRPRDGKDWIPSMVREEYGFEPARWEPERLWLSVEAAPQGLPDVDATRAVRSFSMTGDDES